MSSRVVGRVVGSQARRHAHVWLLICMVLAVGLFSSGCSSLGSSAAGAEPPAATSEPTSTPETPLRSPTVTEPGSSLIATARSDDVSIRNAPGGGVRSNLSNPTALGAPLTFMVLERRPGWLKVQLPVRPNGSTGWVAESDVSIAKTQYRLVISMSRHRLDVMHAGQRIARHKVGVGTAATPTPKGTYYLTELTAPPDPSGVYGPYAFGLSAFSEKLQTFAGGPGQLGLHGTDAPRGLGRDVSHGCLRVANSVITQLAGELPLGTPIDIRG
jgi:lipoprotein-anchoring transpeptidase ErfK/SrfK